MLCFIFKTCIVLTCLPAYICADIDLGKKIRRAKVTFSYAADNNDELELQPGQVSAQSECIYSATDAE